MSENLMDVELCLTDTQPAVRYFSNFLITPLDSL